MKQRELLIKKKNEEREQIMLQYNKKVFNNIFKSNKLNLLQQDNETKKKNEHILQLDDVIFF